MEKITSKSNQKIVEIQKLKQKKYRQEQNKILLEGRKVIDEAVKCGLKIENLILTDDTLKLKDCFEYQNLLLVSDSIAKSLSFTVTSQNCFATVIVEPKQKQPLGNKILILDKLQNPDNLGAIIRTAVATGFVDIIAIDSVDIYSDKTIRASMGNVFKVNYIESNYEQIKTDLKQFQICIADMFGQNIFKIDKFCDKIALVIGNEGNGISDEMKKIANQSFSIPMENSVESLNASVSAGIIMYHIKNNMENKGE